MIQSIELRNFKSIKEKYFPLRKLNLLLGLNGMGKSSFIQSLLLLRQSENLANSGLLRLNGLPFEYVDIGTARDARYQYAPKAETTDIILKFKGHEVCEMNFGYEYDSDVLSANSWSPAKSAYISQNYSEGLFSDDNFQYLNANRIPPQSVHTKGSSIVKSKNIGKEGEYTVHYIEMFGNEDISFENLLHKNSINKDNVTEKDLTNKTLINQINLWMGEISPNVNIQTTSIASDKVKLEYSYTQRNFGYTNRFMPENAGFGISYALHVVTALLASRPGELIIIENPESHIHPRGQVELGKLIALTSQNDVQLIIETHSDHIINGIRVAVKENPALKDNAIIFFFEKEMAESEQYSKITNIEIDKNGELSDYPQGFLDEWSNQLLKLL